MADEIRTCGDLDERLTPYVDGEDPPASRRAVDQHLSACPPCQEAARDESSARELVRSHREALCAHAPETVEAMILVDAALPRTRRIEGQFPPRVAVLFGFYSVFRGLGSRMLDRRMQRLGAERIVEETLRLCTVDPSRIDPRLVRSLVENTARRQGLEYASKAFMDAAGSIFNAQARPGRYREIVKRAHGPALLIHGRQDRLVPISAAREAVTWHDDWELVELEDAGHIPQMEVPDRWIAVVHDWLSRTSLGDRAAAV